jgi:hypothetical protein
MATVTFRPFTVTFPDLPRPKPAIEARPVHGYVPLVSEKTTLDVVELWEVSPKSDEARTAADQLVPETKPFSTKVTVYRLRRVNVTGTVTLAPGTVKFPDVGLAAQPVTTLVW